MIESNAQWWSIDNLKKKNHDKFFLKEKFFECFSIGRYNVYLDVFNGVIKEVIDKCFSIGRYNVYLDGKFFFMWFISSRSSIKMFS